MSEYEKLLIENFFVDLSKHELDDFSKAKLIKKYLEENTMSIREFAARFHLAKSTVEDWLLWNRIEETEYKSMLKNGKNKTDIYRMLRNTKGDDLKEFTELDQEIIIITHKLSSGCIKQNKGVKTIELIKELEKAVRTALFRLENDK